MALPIRILLVEDNPGDVALVELMLSECDEPAYSVNSVGTLSEAMELLNSCDFNAALLDMSLPDGEGLENVVQIKSRAPELPIIVMTGRQDEAFAVNTVQAGAQDYLIKGKIDGWQLTRSLSYSIARKVLEDQMSYLAHHDQLTGLANRVLFHDRLEQSIIRAGRRQEIFAVLYLDLDHFKSINDALGHHIGDEVLKFVSHRLLDSVRDSDTVARLGGDEFAIILDNLGTSQSASSVANKIIEKISKPFEIADHTLYIGTSIGIATYPFSGAESDELLKNADSAMYKAKNAGRGKLKFYSSDMNASALEDLEMEIELREALSNDEFVLHYQPKMNLESGRITGTEALLRWKHPRKGLIYPDEFIPILENNGLIFDVGQWVIEAACKQNQLWHSSGIEIGKVAINLSGKQLLHQDLAHSIATVLFETGLSPSLLEVELTENLLIQNTHVCTDILDSLSKLGVSIAIDDFGTGYCSFNYLKKFLVDTLKIDRSFVRNVASDNTDSAITTAMIGLARDLNINIVAEGVENKGQLDYFRDKNTDEIQGYFISPPIPAESMTRLMENEFRSHHDSTSDIRNLAGSVA